MNNLTIKQIEDATGLKYEECSLLTRMAIVMLCIDGEPNEGVKNEK